MKKHVKKSRSNKSRKYRGHKAALIVSLVVFILVGFLAINFFLPSKLKQNGLISKKTVKADGDSSVLGAAVANYPSDVFDITNWYLTLPTGIENSPDLIRQPALKTYSSEYFHLNDTRNAVVFKAHTGGATTSGSDYPRSELRELKPGGDWSSSSGIHMMYIKQAITALPTYQKSVVIGQIHNASDDVIVIRLDGTRLYINAHTKSGNGGVVNTDLLTYYQPGRVFTIKFEVQNNKTKVYFNKTLKYTLSRSFSSAYFKAGVYTQSSCYKFPQENCNSYGESVLYDLKTCHGSPCVGTNFPPTVYMQVKPGQGTLSDYYAFDINGSYDPDGTLEYIEWDFGDGTPVVRESIGDGADVGYHRFPGPGTYVMKVKVIDNQGGIGNASTTVIVP